MSKANQAFKHNDEAVSPVIGVILMVAITVVLAAVVFVLVSNLGSGSEAAPSVSFNKDSNAGTVTVVRADSGLKWIQGSTAGNSTAFTSTFTPTPANALVVNGCDVATENTDVQAGDTLTNCVGSVSIRHQATNTLVYSTTF